MRNSLTTIGLVAAVAVVWGVALTIVDRADLAPSRVRFASSPTAHIERRPALFVVACRLADARETAGELVMGEAVPIALVEPSGELRPPTDDPTPGAVFAFTESYYRRGGVVTLLRGGSAAGVLRLDPSLSAGEGNLVGRGRCEGRGWTPIASGPPIRLTLGVSDARLGVSESGLRPMREGHRASAEQLLREQAALEHPGARLSEIEGLRVRVADLDRDGRPELLAAAGIRGLGADGRPLSLHCLVIGEPVDDAAAFAAAYARVAPSEDARHCEFVDQVDLSPAAYDELVTRETGAGDGVYAVLRRGARTWREIYRSPRNAE